MRVNCSFSDPICTMNMAKSVNVILLMASSPCGRNAQSDLSHSANQRTSPALLRVNVFFHWLRMWDEVQIFETLRYPLCLFSCYISRRSQRAAANHLYAAVWFLQGFIQHWSMGMERGLVSQDFLSFCKLGLLSPLCSFYLLAHVRRQREGPVSKHTGPSLKFSTYTFCTQWKWKSGMRVFWQE